MKDLNGISKSHSGHGLRCSASSVGRDTGNIKIYNRDGAGREVCANRRMGGNSIFPNIRGGIHKKLRHGFSLLSENDFRPRQAEYQIHEKPLRYLARKLERLHESCLDPQGHEDSYRIFKSDHFNIEYWLDSKRFVSPHGIQRGTGGSGQGDKTIEKRRKDPIIT